MAFAGVAVTAAMAVVGYGLVSGNPSNFAVMAGMAALAVANCVILWLFIQDRSWIARRLSRGDRMAADLREQIERLGERVEHQSAVVAHQAQAQYAYVAAQPAPVAEPAFAPPPQPYHAAPATQAEAEHQPEPHAPEPEAVEFGAQLNFSLEPIIDIPTQRTAHYRLHPGMALSDGDITGEAMLRRAVEGGFREELDFLAVSEALGLLKRLRARDGALCILVPIGVETLRQPEIVKRICECCELAPMEAQGLILELPHVALAGVSGAALEGLAALARSGIGFGLSNVAVTGLDFEAMRQLNIKFTGISATSIGQGTPPVSMINFGQIARISRVNVYVSDIRDAAIVGNLANVARLACGPCFATPRRVKRVTDLPEEAGAVMTSLAA